MADIFSTGKLRRTHSEVFLATSYKSTIPYTSNNNRLRNENHISKKNTTKTDLIISQCEGNNSPANRGSSVSTINLLPVAAVPPPHPAGPAPHPAPPAPPLKSLELPCGRIRSLSSSSRRRKGLHPLSRFAVPESGRDWDWGWGYRGGVGVGSRPVGSGWVES